MPTTSGCQRSLSCQICLTFKGIINLTKVSEESGEKVQTIGQIGNAHDLTA